MWSQLLAPMGTRHASTSPLPHFLEKRGVAWDRTLQRGAQKKKVGEPLEQRIVKLKVMSESYDCDRILEGVLSAHYPTHTCARAQNDFQRK